MVYNSLKVETDGAVAVVTISRPKALNALDIATISELSHCFTSLEENENLRVIIFTGDGEKAFVAGADIPELQKSDMAAAMKLSANGHALFSRIENSRLISIAAVNGFALGGGCELAMACDIRYASEIARFGQPEINLGIIPGYGGTQRLPRLIGQGKALELLLTGDMIKADEALRLSLVSAVFPLAELLPASRKLAEKIVAKSPQSVSAIKRSVRRGLDSSLQSGCEIETAEFAAIFATQDKTEGTTAFIEKRPAKFIGK